MDLATNTYIVHTHAHTHTVTYHIGIHMRRSVGTSLVPPSLAQPTRPNPPPPGPGESPFDDSVCIIHTHIHNKQHDSPPLSPMSVQPRAFWGRTIYLPCTLLCVWREITCGTHLMAAAPAAPACMVRQTSVTPPCQSCQNLSVF